MPPPQANAASKMNSRHVTIALLIGLFCVNLMGCKPRVESANEATSSAAPPLIVTDELQAKLAAADAADGQVDQVVSQCVTCGLAMEGKEDCAETVGDYSIELCSPTCQQVFKKDPAKALLALDN